MAQFDVYRNANPATRSRVPFLLDVQSELLDSLVTRVVVPMCKPELLKGKVAEGLNPTFEVEGRTVALLTPELAGVPVKALGKPIANLAANRREIIGALDLLLTGI